MPNQHEGKPATLPTHPLAEVSPKAILARYLSDESTKDIAASYGVTRQALGQFLLKTAEDEWRNAQVARALARKEAAEDDLENEKRTPDALSLARTRERLKAAQWDLERVCRRIYGQDQPPAGAAQVAIQINLRRSGATIAAQHGDSAVDLTSVK